MQNIGQNKRHWCNNNVKMKNNKFVKDHFKNCTCYNFNDISKLEDFYFDDILIDDKLNENILIYDIWMLY